MTSDRNRRSPRCAEPPPLQAVRHHRWDLSPRAAAQLQAELAVAVIARGAGPREPLLVAGCDATGSGRWARGDEEITAAVLLFRHPGGQRIDAACARRPALCPYIPGLLSFREIPVYLEAFARLRHRPDLILCDGQGIAHPRGLGLAAHLGLLLDLPSIGVAKSRLIGTYREPGHRRGSATRLIVAGRVAGRVVRTRDGVRPLFVSPGHRIGVAAAARWTLRLASRYRLPEPTRLADIWVTQLRRDLQAPPPNSSSR